MTLEDFLGRLDGVRREGVQHVGRCPGHQDRRPSLAVRQRGNRILIHCRSMHCRPEEILSPLGLVLADLFVNAPRTSRNSEIKRQRPETPMQAARREILAEARRQPWARLIHADWPDGPTWRLASACADLVRELHRQADRLQMLAKVEGPSSPKAWRLIAAAAELEIEAAILESALDGLAA